MSRSQENVAPPSGTASEPHDEAPARNYFFLVLAALALILIVLLRRGMGIASMVPVIIGLLSVMLPWRAIPFLTMVSLAAILFRLGPEQRAFLVWRSPGFYLDEWILSAAALAYCLAIFRLRALTGGYFPMEMKRSPRRAAGTVNLENRRDPRLVPGGEIALLLLTVPIWALLAQAGRQLLFSLPVEPVEMDRRIWQMIALAWMTTIAVATVAGLLGFAGWRNMDKLAAKLYFQDSIWYEVRGEQRRFLRWLVWFGDRSTRKVQP